MQNKKDLVQHTLRLMLKFQMLPCCHPCYKMHQPKLSSTVIVKVPCHLQLHMFWILLFLMLWMTGPFSPFCPYQCYKNRKTSELRTEIRLTDFKICCTHCDVIQVIPGSPCLSLLVNLLSCVSLAYFVPQQNYTFMSMVIIMRIMDQIAITQPPSCIWLRSTHCFHWIW